MMNDIDELREGDLPIRCEASGCLGRGVGFNDLGYLRLGNYKQVGRCVTLPSFTELNMKNKISSLHITS